MQAARWRVASLGDLEPGLCRRGFGLRRLGEVEAELQARLGPTKSDLGERIEAVKKAGLVELVYEHWVYK